MTSAKSVERQAVPSVQRWMEKSLPVRLVNKVSEEDGSMSTRPENGDVPPPTALHVVPLGPESAGERSAAKLSRVPASTVSDSAGCGATLCTSASAPSCAFKLSKGRCAEHAPLFSAGEFKVR